MSFLRILFIGLLFMGCKDDTGITVGENEILVQFEKTATKEIGEQEWTIEFETIEENSLCAPDVTCVWHGRIVVSLKINGEQVTLGLGDLTTNVAEALQNQIAIDGTTITFSEAIDYTENSKMKIVLTFE
jgi:hypothetical protein